MKNKKLLWLAIILTALLVLDHGPALAANRVLTDTELDRVQSAGLPFLQDIDEWLTLIVSLAGSQSAAEPAGGIMSINSSVVTQSNIAILVNFSGTLRQINTAEIFN